MKNDVLTLSITDMPEALAGIRRAAAEAIRRHAEIEDGDPVGRRVADRLRRVADEIETGVAEETI